MKLQNLALLSGLALLFAYLPGPAHADNITVRSNTTLCLDLRGGSDANGTPIQLWACAIDNASQKFGIMSNGEIRTKFKCLSGGANQGDPVVLAPCGAASQRWTRTAAGELRGNGGRCLDVRTSQFRNGTPLQMYTCNSTAAQAFSVYPAEQCFGAIGNGCMGAAPASPGPAAFLPGNNRRQLTSIGSILHDNCCRQNPEGQHCQGFDFAQEGRADNQACVVEWRKAVYNSRDNRTWQATFGAYGSALTSDNLTQVSGRGAVLFNSSGAQIGRSTRNETVSTLRLKAPIGTALDLGDQTYCASGTFSRTFAAGWGVGAYGICR